MKTAQYFNTSHPSGQSIQDEFMIQQYTPGTIQRWQYICDLNFGKSRSIFSKCPPHLNIRLTLPCEN